MSVLFLSSFCLALYFICSWRYYVIICGINNVKFTNVAVCNWELLFIIFLLKFYCEKSDEVGHVILVLERLRQQEYEFQAILSYIVSSSQPVVHRRPKYKKKSPTIFFYFITELFSKYYEQGILCLWVYICHVLLLGVSLVVTFQAGRLLDIPLELMLTFQSGSFSLYFQLQLVKVRI